MSEVSLDVSAVTCTIPGVLEFCCETESQFPSGGAGWPIEVENARFKVKPTFWLFCPAGSALTVIAAVGRDVSRLIVSGFALKSPVGTLVSCTGTRRIGYPSAVI